MVFPTQLKNIKILQAPLKNTNKWPSLNKVYSVYLLFSVQCPVSEFMLPLTVFYIAGLLLGFTVKYSGGSGISAAGGSR